MGKYKNFKTYIRKKIGLFGVGEFVDDAIAANSMSNWNSWFSNKRYLKEYVSEARIKTYIETIKLCEQEGVTFSTGIIIDVGCGTGHFLKELKKRHSSINIVGTDFSEESVNISKSINPEGSFFLMDIFNIPIEQQGIYDFVICSEVLEHLLRPDVALDNLLSLIKSEGFLIITVPNGRLDTYGGHINFWSPESWKEFIIKHIDCSIYKHIAFKTFNNNKNNFVLISRNPILP